MDIKTHHVHGFKYQYNTMTLFFLTVGTTASQVLLRRKRLGRRQRQRNFGEPNGGGYRGEEGERYS